ncbi:hypothetical protein HY312_02290 [Candidatus Saccharibacteria bacterium]|nr:hypothetical protein [Candidatus Saccharibacteria bacterium]
MKVLAIADRNPGIDIVQTVVDEDIELVITLGILRDTTYWDYSRSTLFRK